MRVVWPQPAAAALAILSDETPEHPALDTTRFVLVHFHFQLLALLALASFLFTEPS